MIVFYDKETFEKLGSYFYLLPLVFTTLAKLRLKKSTFGTAFMLEGAGSIAASWTCNVAGGMTVAIGIMLYDMNLKGY